MLEFVKRRGIRESSYLSQTQFEVLPLPAEKALLEVFESLLASGWVVNADSCEWA